MAGIGFELRRMLHGDAGIGSRLRALLTATTITAGPWLLTMVTLLLVTWPRLGAEAASSPLFHVLVTYVFAASMITVGAVQMPMTRHLADLLHDRRHDRVLPAYVAAIAGVAAFQAVTGALASLLFELSPLERALLTALYVAVSLNWLAMAWLTVIRQHLRIALAYLLGLAAAAALTTTLPDRAGIAAPLLAYGCGQGLTFLLLSGLLVRGLAFGDRIGKDVWTSIARYPSLLLIGGCHALGVWIDKIVFWIGDGVAIASGLRVHPLYDTSCFLAYLTVLPALALNLIVLETRFYERYRSYYDALVRRQPLREVEWHRNEMVETLRDGAIMLLRWQGLCTGLAIVFAPVLLELFGMPLGMVRPFRLACLGAFFQVLFLIALLVLLYFDLRRQALRHALVFCLGNGVLAGLSLFGDYPLYGVGYALAGFISLFLAVQSLQRALPELEYRTLRRAAIGR